MLGTGTFDKCLRLGFGQGNVGEHVLSDGLWHFGSPSLTGMMLGTTKRAIKITWVLISLSHICLRVISAGSEHDTIGGPEVNQSSTYASLTLRSKYIPSTLITGFVDAFITVME
jgi:hypothetical protein